MSNAYLKKIAEFHYIRHEVDDPEEQYRREVVDDGNSFLLSKGFKPTLQYDNATSRAVAEDLEDRSFKADIRPHEASSNVKSLLAGLATGLATGAGVGVATKDPILGILAGAWGSMASGKLVKHISYDSDKKKADDATVKDNHEKLVEFLKQRYERY